MAIIAQRQGILQNGHDNPMAGILPNGHDSPMAVFLIKWP